GTGRAATLVAAGILASRLLGVVRQSFMTRFLGATSGIAADAFMAAFKIPNLLQNLFGEGALSASFIPVYSNLLARNEREEAGRVAGAVAAILALVTAVLVLLGVLLAPYLIPLIAPGFSGAKRELTVRLTRVLFPGAGIFVLGAWCLGVLNSHRKFFLSYAAAVLWNMAMIAALLLFRRQRPIDLAVTLAWASVVGAALQVLAQLPTVLRLVPQLRIALDTTRASVRRVLGNFAPVFVSRGVVQLSAYVDQWLASFLPQGMVALLGYAVSIYTLPVSLFGIAISAAELPEMSSAIGSAEEMARYLRTRLDTGLRRIAFFVVPSAAAFLALGDAITRALYQGGRFTATDTTFTWGILAGSAVGLLANTLGRLYSSTYYALHDTRTPLRFALVRVVLTTVLGFLFALPLPRLLGIDPRWGAAGLTASAGIAGWVEFLLLRSRLNHRIGRTGLTARFTGKLWFAALLAVVAGLGLKAALAGTNRFVGAVVVLGAFSLIYAVVTVALAVPEARQLLAQARWSRSQGAPRR
ncbi:MAG TPA: murein biosynthesis integral membrane protein MurJ, partial [Gemmatimonadaceae bacterium]|nr:murein biosynthesis integral membrane protein MurJ [Gemmatimonadaceae bacterium]